VRHLPSDLNVQARLRLRPKTTRPKTQDEEFDLTTTHSRFQGLSRNSSKISVIREIRGFNSPIRFGGCDGGWGWELECPGQTPGGLNPIEPKEFPSSTRRTEEAPRFPKFRTQVSKIEFHASCLPSSSHPAAPNEGHRMGRAHPRPLA
jgi:hypothetical protein